MKWHASGLTAISLLLCPTLASGQTEAASQNSASPAGGILPTPPPPAGRTDGLLNGAAVDFSISDKEPEASIEVGHMFPLAPGSHQGTPTFRSANWNVKLTLPLSGDSDLTSSSTLLGILDGPTLSVNLGLLGYRPANLFGGRFATIMETSYQNCLHGPDVAARALCTPRADPDFARRYSGLTNAEIDRALFSWMWRIGFEGSVTANRFPYVEAVSLQKRNEANFSYSAGLVGALYPPDAVSALIGHATYERSYKAGDKTIICRPVVTDPAHDCVNGVPTRPERADHFNLSIEYRRIFDTGLRSGSLAISPQFTIDALSGNVTAELPVYFIPRDSDFPFSPGLSIAYSTEKHMTFGVFLRKTFSFGG